MPVVEWTRWVGRRVMGEDAPVSKTYVWEASNGYRCYVEPPDYLEVITNPDFVVIRGDELRTLTGLRGDDLQTLELLGVVSLRDLVAVDTEAISHALGTDLQTVETWQEQASSQL
jgi:predicted RecB family nuclease